MVSVSDDRAALLDIPPAHIDRIPAKLHLADYLNRASTSSRLCPQNYLREIGGEWSLRPRGASRTRSRGDAGRTSLGRASLDRMQHLLPLAAPRAERASEKVFGAGSGNQRRGNAALFAGELDAAIVYSTRSDRRVVFRDLFKDELVIIAHPEHRPAARKFVEPLDSCG